MRKQIKYLMFALSLSLLFFLLQVKIYSQSEMEGSKIDTFQQNIITVDLAKRIALFKAKEIWGQVSLGNPIISQDLDGSINAYIIPYKVGDKTFPSDEEIIHEISLSRQELDNAIKELARIRTKCLQAGRVEVIEEAGKARINKPLEWLQAEEKVRKLEKKTWGIEDYGTFVISATKGLGPILLSSNGLPAYYNWRPMAEQKAKEALQSSSVRISRYFFSPPMDEMFEYEEKNGNKVWIKLYPLKVYLPGEVKKNDKKLSVEVWKQDFQTTTSIQETEAEWVNKKWQELLKEVEHEK